VRGFVRHLICRVEVFLERRKGYRRWIAVLFAKRSRCLLLRRVCVCGYLGSWCVSCALLVFLSSTLFLFERATSAMTSPTNNQLSVAGLAGKRPSKRLHQRLGTSVTCHYTLSLPSIVIPYPLFALIINSGFPFPSPSYTLMP
jgi:hypothetical protein